MRTTTLLLLFLTALCALAPPRRAADPSGTWRAEQTGRNGAPQVTTYVLEANGGQLAGWLITARDRRAILDGAIDGDAITFATQDQFNPAAGKTLYRATLAGDALSVQVVSQPARGGGGAPGRAGRGPAAPLQLRRISADTAYLPPPELIPGPLPAFHPLPPNGLASTPPMGWNSWYTFRAQIDDAAVRANADALVASGMRDAGYIYVNIDDGWEGARDAAGNLHPNSKFPGMKALADYVHARGLKLGIYSSPGPATCGGYAGSFNHETQDARAYAAWGVDFVKYDWCSASLVYDAAQMKAAYEKMALALRATRRPMVFSLCQYGDLDVGAWGAAVGGNLWRTTGDMQDRWEAMARIGFGQMGRESAAGKGHWNDPDMLQVGIGGMTDTEYRTQFSLWSMLAAPLLAGNDVSKMSDATRAILLNREVIAVDQDPLGRQGARSGAAGDLEVWTKPLARGATAVGLFNRGESTATMQGAWAGLGLRPAAERDLWAHRDLPAGAGYSFEVPAHGVVLLRVR